MLSFDNKNILITGATGLIGSHLVEFLMKNTTANVYVVGRSMDKLTKIFGDYPRTRLVCIEQDATLPITVEEPLDFVFHAAGPIDSKTIKERPMDIIMPNVWGVNNCLEFARRQQKAGQQCRVIVFSSVTVYEGTNKERVSETDIAGGENIDALSACYSESKRYSEVIAKAMFRQYQVDVVIARFSYVYGISFFEPDTAFYQLLRDTCEGKNLVIQGAGLPRRDNIYIEDAISGLITVALMGKSGEAYNISSAGEKGNFAAIDEMAETMVSEYNKLSNTNLTVKYQQEPRERKRGIVVDNSKLKTLGWSVTVSLQEGIGKIIKRKKQQQEG